MEHETSVEVTAPPEAVFAVLVDVARWPEWTPTVTAAVPEGDGPIVVGARYRLRQPGMAEATWEVTALDPGRRFEWATGRPGFRLTADHIVDEAGPGRSRVALRLTVGGLVGHLAALLAGGKMRRLVDQEAAGLKERCETAG